MTIDYDGKVAVITGGASGIGRSVALAMAARGADVVIADVHDERLADVESELVALGRRALAVHCDVGADADVERLRDDTLRVMGRADIVMNNAGVAVRGAFEQIPMDDWEWIVNINLLGVVRGCRAFVPHLGERGSGYLVNTASIGGLAGAVISMPYVATKHAVVGLSESLSLYLRPKGVGVSVLCPAGVATNILENLRKAGTDESMWGRPNEAAAGGGGGGGAGMQTPDRVADLLLAAMDEDRFVVPTFPVVGAVGKRIEAIERLATPRS
jgi:NAD(P)-dependent dehydrogenase (short-subunit alcohol dehydrogenase family)